LQIEEVEEVWTRRRKSGWRRSVVPMVFPGRGGEGRVNGVVPGRFYVEEEQGTDVEAHVEDVEEGARWRRMRRRSGRRQVCDAEMKDLEFRGSGTLNKKNSNGHDDVINVRRYI
jgi:hypothetical protein